MEELFQSGSIDQNLSSANWPLAKILQRYINHVTRRLGLRLLGVAFEVRDSGFCVLILDFRVKVVENVVIKCHTAHIVLARFHL